jgi:hypothetical protein
MWSEATRLKKSNFARTFEPEERIRESIRVQSIETISHCQTIEESACNNQRFTI